MGGTIKIICIQGVVTVSLITHSLPVFTLVFSIYKAK